MRPPPGNRGRFLLPPGYARFIIDFANDNCYVSILVIEEEVYKGVVSPLRVSLMARSHILKVMDDWLE